MAFRCALFGWFLDSKTNLMNNLKIPTMKIHDFFLIT